MNVRIVNTSANPLPAYATVGSAGMDLYANNPEPITLLPLQREAIPTGIFLEIPVGYEAQVRPRSGLALKHGITCVNSPGTIDSDYRGEVKVILVNLGAEPVTIQSGERVAQLVVAQYERVAWQPVASLSESERGTGGFGSTGV